MTWLKNRTHDHRPDVKSLACMVYAQRFPRQVRNQKKQELSIQTLKLNIDGDICDPYGDPVYIKESYQVSRTPPAVVRIQQDGAPQTVSPPSIAIIRIAGKCRAGRPRPAVLPQTARRVVAPYGAPLSAILDPAIKSWQSS